MKDYVKNNITWTSQGCLRIQTSEGVIYTDPFDIPTQVNDADVVLITHEHFDHFSVDDIKKVIKADTKFVFPESMKEASVPYSDNGIYYVKAEDELAIDGIKINSVPAYNIDKIQCHPRENGWVGYIINVDGISLYYTSDTELIPEMSHIITDVIFTPLGQTYTMNSVEDAAKAVEATKAKIAVPIHYGKYEGSVQDAEKFIDLLKDKVEVIKL